MLYTIQKGDTLSGLAKTYDTTVRDIMLANPKIKNKNLIYAGDTINIPSKFGLVGGGWFTKLWNWYKGLFRV